MILASRDIGWIIAILIQIISFVGIFAVYKQKIDVVRKVIFNQDGTLNVVDKESCKEHRVEIKDTQKEYEADSKEVIKQLHALNINVALIMQHFKVERE